MVFDLYDDRRPTSRSRPGPGGREAQRRRGDPGARRCRQVRARHPGDHRPGQQGEVPRLQVLPRGRPDLRRRRHRPDLSSAASCSPSPTISATSASSPTCPRSRASRTSTSIYVDLSHRLHWQVELFDTAQLLHRPGSVTGLLTRDQPSFEETGAVASIIYPFSFYHRVEVGAGYMIRKIDFHSSSRSNGQGSPGVVIAPSSDNFPVVTVAVVGDSADFAHYGAGGRPPLPAGPALAPEPRQDGGGTIYSSATLDCPQVLPAHPAQQLRLPRVGRHQRRQPPDAVLPRRPRHRARPRLPLVGRRPRVLRQPRVPLPADRPARDAGARLPAASAASSSSTSARPGSTTCRSSSSRARSTSLVDGVAAYGAGFNFNLLGLEANVGLRQALPTSRSPRGSGPTSGSAPGSDLTPAPPRAGALPPSRQLRRAPAAAGAGVALSCLPRQQERYDLVNICGSRF